MHVQAVLDAIKKRGHFDDYEKAASKFKEAREAIESAKAGLSLLEESVAKKAKEVKKKAKKEKAKEGDEVTLKAPAKARKAKEGDEVTLKTPEKAAESTADVQEAQDAPETDDQLKVNYLSELETAKRMHRIAKGVMAAAASKMFSFYSNLLSPESKYAWNKIVCKQTGNDPYVNLQGDTLQGPRGMSRQSFCDCVMFHLLTAFPINAAEQEK
jgi:hypothetical protein